MLVAAVVEGVVPLHAVSDGGQEPEVRFLPIAPLKQFHEVRGPTGGVLPGRGDPESRCTSVVAPVGVDGDEEVSPVVRGNHRGKDLDFVAQLFQ